MANSDLEIMRNDVSIPSLGLPNVIQRTFHSMASVSSTTALGHQWQLSVGTQTYAASNVNNGLWVGFSNLRVGPTQTLTGTIAGRHREAAPATTSRRCPVRALPLLRGAVGMTGSVRATTNGGPRRVHGYRISWCCERDPAGH